MSETWVGSFLGGDIPQLDGAADDDSDGKEDFKIPRGKRRKGKPRKRSDQAKNTINKSGLSTPRENSQTIPVDSKASGRIVERGKTEKDGESLSVDVWPQSARAIRTYSKKGMSVLKRQRSLPLNEEERTATKSKEETIVVDTEEEVEEEKEEKDECEDEFRLVLSESSDSEDNITKEANLGSKRYDDMGCQKNLSLEEYKRSKRNPSSPQKDQGTSGECYLTPVITKYFHSPEKNTKRTRKQDEEPLNSVEHSSDSSITVDEYSLAEVLPHCSNQYGGFSRKSTLRKRKLTEKDRKERKKSQGMSLRRTNQNTDLVKSLSVVSGAMTGLRVPLNDVSHTPKLSSKFDEAEKRLRKRRENPRENFTLVNQRLSSPTRIERLSETRSPLRLRKNEKSPLPKKRSSPKRKEERMRKYGTLPVVIAKSPKKNQAADNVEPDNVSLNEAGRLPTKPSSASRQCEVQPSLHSSQIFRDAPVNSNVLNSGTGRVSSRSRTRVSGLFSSCLIATATTGGNKETSHSVPLSSRGLSLKSADRSRDKSRSEKGHALSLQRKELKRKLIVDTEKDIQSTTPKVVPGMGKKRKLSLTLKVDKSRPELKEEGASETIVTSNENCLAEEHNSVCKVKEQISNTQQAGPSIESNDTSSRSESTNDFPLDTALSDDIICIPSSPGDSDSNDEPPNRADYSAAIVESTSLPVSAKTHLPCNKSEDNSNSSVSDENEHKVAVSVNDLQLLSHENYGPKEKETELLANALFNMSFPSPLPCVEECHSPPCPSSPLDIKHDTSDLGNQHSILQRRRFFPVNSSIVEEQEGKVSDVEELERLPASSLSQVQQTAYSSPADVRLREKSSLLHMRPQLGETQTHFEHMEYSDANVSRQLESKSIEIENSADCLNQIVDDKEMASDKESFDSCKNHINNSNLSMENENPTIDESIEVGRMDSESNSKFAIFEDKSQGQKIESNKPVAALTSHDSTRIHLLQTSGTDVAETEEQSSTSPDEREFVLKLSAAEDNSTDRQPLVHSDLHISEMEISVEEENQAQEITSESLHYDIALASQRQQDDQNKSQICSTQGWESVPNRSSLEHDKNGRLGRKNVIAIEPLKRPPTSEELVKSLKDYGLPQCRYQEPFCSDQDDIPACPRLVTCLLRTLSCILKNLPRLKETQQ